MPLVKKYLFSVLALSLVAVAFLQTWFLAPVKASDDGITVNAYAWTPTADVDAHCTQASCLHYDHIFGLNDGESATLTQKQSWPVLLTWTSTKPITIPALGILNATTSGEAYFNPWQNMTIAVCDADNCDVNIAIKIVGLEARNDCVAQTLDGMYAQQPLWLQSMGEAYGVSNLDGEYCTDWTCTKSAPHPACFGTNKPNKAECTDGGCECNLEPWSHPAANELEYKAVISAIQGVRAPWFADRWETGGLRAVNDGDTVFRMSTKVSLDDANLLFRPVIDMRTNWDGTWSTIPGPDGWEGPPIFKNSINDFIAPVDGYWPVTWEISPDVADTDVWMQPVWNVIVKPGGENGTAKLKDLHFEACGSQVHEIVCDYSGCR